jgi:hypothetical protein
MQKKKKNGKTPPFPPQLVYYYFTQQSGFPTLFLGRQNKKKNPLNTNNEYIIIVFASSTV